LLRQVTEQCKPEGHQGAVQKEWRKEWIKKGPQKQTSVAGYWVVMMAFKQKRDGGGESKGVLLVSDATCERKDHLTYSIHGSARIGDGTT